MHTSYWKCCCTGIVAWQREKESSVMTQTDSKTPQADQFHVASGDTMKAIVYTHYGSPEVLQFKEVAKPTPRDNEVLVQVHAASVNAADLHFLRGRPVPYAPLELGFSNQSIPILGAAIAGRVEAIGRNVTQIQPGDEVFGDLSECGLGGFAEYVCASEEALALKPAHVTFEQAAAIPLAAVTALQGLRDQRTHSGGTKGVDLWCVWRCGHVCSTDCQSIRG